MRKLLIILAAFAVSFPSFAADNTVIVTPGLGVTMKSKDVGSGVQAMQPIISDVSGNPISFAGQNATSPGSSLLVGCQFNTTPTTITNSNASACQLDNAGNLLVNVKTATGLAQGSTTSGQTGSLILGAVTTAIPTYSNAQSSPISIGLDGSLRTSVSPYPTGSIPYTATATGTTGATTATLAGASSVTTYICGFSIRANATAAATGNATVTGVITATLNFTQWTAPNASGLGITEMIFAPCIPASATNTSIAVVSAAPGTGGVVSVTSWGYKL